MANPTDTTAKEMEDKHPLTEEEMGALLTTEAGQVAFTQLEVEEAVSSLGVLRQGPWGSNRSNSRHPAKLDPSEPQQDP